MVKRRAPKGKEFYLHDGTQVSTIEELYRYLKESSDEDYSKHVGPGKNDFASWIKGVHGKSFLSEALKKTTTRSEAVALLHSEIRKYEKLADRLKQREYTRERKVAEIGTEHGNFVTKEFVFGFVFGLILGLLLMGVLGAI